MSYNNRYPIEGTVALDDGEVWDVKVAEAGSFMERFMGLMGKREVPALSGLLFRKCTSIHMFFMRVPLDIVWLGEVDGETGRYPVIAVDRGLLPWRLVVGPRGTRHVAEFAAGTFPAGCDPMSLGVEGA